MMVTLAVCINLMNIHFPGQSVSSVCSDAVSERSQEVGNGERQWSAEPAVNGHSLSPSHHNGYLKGEVSSEGIISDGSRN